MMSYMNDLSLSQTAIDFDSDLDPLDALDTIEEESTTPDPETMLRLIRSDNKQEQIQAVRAFCEITEPRVTPILIELLNDTSPLVRVSAAYALGRNTSPDAVEPLINLLTKDWNGYVRKGIVWALGNCSDSRAFKPLMKALTKRMR